MSKTLYETLGVGPDASPDEIKGAYRRAARRTHPDMGGKREDFDRVQLAYNILSDDSRRQRYNDTGSENPTDPVELLRRQALSTVAGKMQALLNDPHVDPCRFDLVLGIRELIEVEANDARSKIAESKRMQERLRIFEKRLKRKKNQEGADAVRPMITSQIEAHAQRIAAIEDALKVLAAAKEIAAEYVYEVDKQQAVPMHIQPAAGGASSHPWFRY